MKALNPMLLLIILAIASFFLFCNSTNALSVRIPRELTVQQGDTLWSIAVRLVPEEDPRQTIDRIVSLNGLASMEIKPGQLLYVP